MFFFVPIRRRTFSSSQTVMPFDQAPTDGFKPIEAQSDQRESLLDGLAACGDATIGPPMNSMLRLLGEIGPSTTALPTVLFRIFIGEPTYSPGVSTRPDYGCMASPRRSSGKCCESMQQKGDPRCTTAFPYWSCCCFWVRAGLPAVNQLPIPARNQVPAHPSNQLPAHRLNHLPVQVLNQLAVRALNQVPAQPINQIPGR
jgi:hypothetical protein